MKKEEVYQLNQVFTFSREDAHPESKIIGIDSYSFEADDGSNKNWNSYTLVPIQEDERFGDIPTYIYGDKTAMIIFEEDDVEVFVIQHLSIARYFRGRFLAMWKEASE